MNGDVAKDLEDLEKLVDLFQSFEEDQNKDNFTQIIEEKKKIIVDLASFRYMKQFLQITALENYKTLLPSIIVGSLEKVLKKFGEGIQITLTEFTCQLTRKFSKKPIRIRKTRVIFDRDAFLQYFKKNQKIRDNEVTGKKQKYISCPVMNVELTHPVKHQSKQLLRKLDEFYTELRGNGDKLFEFMIHFFQLCKPVEEMEKIEPVLLSILKNYEIALSGGISDQYLTQKISLLNYFCEIFKEETSNSSIRKNELIDTIFQVSMKYFEDNNFQQCIVYFEEKLLNKFKREEIGKSRVRTSIFNLRVSYFNLYEKKEGQEDLLEEKIVYYLFSYLDTFDDPFFKNKNKNIKSINEDLRNNLEEKFESMIKYLEYFPSNDKLFEKIFEHLFTEITNKYEEHNSDDLIYKTKEEMISDIARKGLFLVDILGRNEDPKKMIILAEKKENKNEDKKEELEGELDTDDDDLLIEEDEEEEEEGEEGNNNNNNKKEDINNNNNKEVDEIKMILNDKIIRVLEELKIITKNENILVLNRLKEIYLKQGKKENVLAILFYLIDNIENFGKYFIQQENKNKNNRNKKITEEEISERLKKMKEKYLEEAVMIDPNNLELIKKSVENAIFIGDEKKIIEITKINRKHEETEESKRINDLIDIRTNAFLKIMNERDKKSKRRIDELEDQVKDSLLKNSGISILQEKMKSDEKRYSNRIKDLSDRNTKLERLWLDIQKNITLHSKEGENFLSKFNESSEKERTLRNSIDEIDQQLKNKKKNPSSSPQPSSQSSTSRGGSNDYEKRGRGSVASSSSSRGTPSGGGGGDYDRRAKYEDGPPRGRDRNYRNNDYDEEKESWGYGSNRYQRNNRGGGGRGRGGW